MPIRVKTPKQISFVLEKEQQKVIVSLSKRLGNGAHKESVKYAFMNFERMMNDKAALQEEIKKLQNVIGNVRQLTIAQDEMNFAWKELNKYFSGK